MTTQTPATIEIEKWLRIRVRFFPKFWLRIRVRKKCRIQPESNPALRIRFHLWYEHIFYITAVAYLGHGTYHGGYFDGRAKIAWIKLELGPNCGIVT